MILVTESSLRPPQATLLLQGAQLRQQSGGFAETAGSVNSEAAAGAQVGRRSHLRAADPDPQLRRLLLRAVPHNGSHGSGKLRGQMFCYLPSQIRAAKKGQNTSGDKKVIWPGGIRPGESTVVSDLPLSTTLKLAILRKRQDYPKEQKSRMLCGQRDRSG